MKIKMTTGIENFHDNYSVRRQVFMSEQGFTSEQDKIDDVCRHFTGYVNDTPVASGRCFNKDRNTMMIGRIAVLKQFRHQGLAKQMMKAIEDYCASISVKRLMLSAQCQAVEFYKRLGYHEVGEVYYDEYCPHKTMVKFLEKNSGIRCLVSDLDGTLLKIGNELSKGVSDENKQTIQRFVQNGNHFAIASSRGADFKAEMDRQLGIEVDFIGSTGAEVAIANKLVFRKTMDLTILPRLSALIKSCDANAVITFFDENDQAWISDYDHYPFVIKDPSSKGRGLWRKPRVYAITQKLLDQHVFKVFAMVEPTDMPKLRKVLKDALLEDYEVSSCDSDLIEILSKNVTKASGIDKLAAAYGLPREAIAAIGDSDNDISMLESCAVSFCMSHSEDAVKNTALYVVDSVREAVEMIEIMNRG